tara:strand:- start:13865 stop:14707 length:843 start_codon:yes stop_codon:yes gene_type:complete
MTINEHIQALNEYGVTVVENVIPHEMVNKIKNTIVTHFDDKDNLCQGYAVADQTIKSNGFNYPEFETCSKIFELQTLLDIMHGITDGHVRWLHHSDVHLNFAGAKGWHTDSQLQVGKHVNDKCPITDIDKETGNDKLGTDYSYQTYRFATYITNHEDEPGACLGVKPYSFHGDGRHTPAYQIDAAPGDVIIFNSKLRHSGGHSNKDRIALFWAFGKDNLYSKYHSVSALNRQCAQNFEDINQYSITPHLANIFDKHNIAYDLDSEILNEFNSISMFNKSY